MARTGSAARVVWTGLLAAVCAIALTSCAKPEDPARVALRERLKQAAPLSKTELDELRAEVSRSMAGHSFRIAQDGASQEMDERRKTIVFGMLTDPAGMFDEGLRTRGASTFRVLNAPGESQSEEIEATRRLWIDIDTLLPGRFEFAYAVPSPEDYGFDLTAAP